MKKFTKVFDTPTSQVLAYCNQDGGDDEDDPGITIMCYSERIGGFSKMTMGFDSEEGRDECFEDIDQELADEFASRDPLDMMMGGD